MIDSMPALVQALRRSRLLTPSQLNDLKSKWMAGVERPQALAERLRDMGWLTSYQEERLFAGAEQDLVFGPYLALNLLGEGGLCQVFKAWHRDSRQVVALKVLHPELRTNPEVLEQLQNEFHVMSRLSHPNFIRAFDVDLHSKQFYFAMEYIPGIDLQKLLEQTGRLPIAQACDYARQAAFGLQYAYERGMVHRDIKPGNLLVSFQGNQVRILDIGLARLEWSFRDVASADTVTRQTASLLGTPDYIAPEQALNSEQANIRADIYSLGCTLYHLLTGQPPFPGNSLTRKLLQHQQAPPPSARQLRPEIPEELALRIQKMMSKQADDRYQTPAGVAVALVAYCKGGEQWADVGQFDIDSRENAGKPVPFPAVDATPKPVAMPHKMAAHEAASLLEERRTHSRRAGNPVRILVADSRTDNEDAQAGYVVNRSNGGLSLLLNDAVEVGTVKRVRSEAEQPYSRWVQVRFLYCYKERGSWRVGCSFLESLTWSEMRRFG